MLFILVVEIMAIAIRKADNINGICIGDKEIRISQYADDTSLILDGTEKCLKATLETLKHYASFSGLKINVKKHRYYG